MTWPHQHRITASARPDGADLDVTPYLRTTLHDLLDLLSERGDLLDDLLSLYADKAPAADSHQAARPSRDDELVEQLLGELPTSIRLHRPVARALGAALGRITRAQARRPLRAVPAQQDRRAS